MVGMYNFMMFVYEWIEVFGCIVFDGGDYVKFSYINWFNYCLCSLDEIDDCIDICEDCMVFCWIFDFFFVFVV